jgi:hypothetical protein
MAKSVSEAQLRMPALQLLDGAPNGFMTMTKMIAKLEGIFKPEGRDIEILKNRSDTHFSRKVRNLVSHRTSSTSLIKRGLITYDKEMEGLQITDAGRAYLKVKAP